MRAILLLLAVVPLALADKPILECRFGKIPKSVIEIKTVKPDPTQEKCLAVTIYGEARGESDNGKIAVAWTAMNRATKKSICKVVLAPKQFSIFNNNPALRMAAMSLNVEPRQKNVIDVASWQRAVSIARAVYRKEISDPTLGATHYLAPVVMKAKGYIIPKWARKFIFKGKIDNQLFYKEI